MLNIAAPQNKIAEAYAIARAAEARHGYRTTNARDLIESGWKNTYRELFGNRFVNALDSAETDDKHHSDALHWHFTARLRLIHYELELRPIQHLYDANIITFDEYSRRKDELQDKWYPEFWAYLAMWARGNMKTTLARYAMIVDAVMSVAFNVGGYALVVGGTKNKARGTAKTIQQMLQSEKVKQYAPALSVVKKNDTGISLGWTAEFINTAANYIFHFIGLDEGVAGANVDNIRPTFIIPDDVDDREDSPVISESRYKTLSASVIGTKQWNTLFFFAQNVISRFSVIYRIWKRQVKVFANRFPTQPVPAVRNLVVEQQTINGEIKDVVISGQCTWRGWNLREVQNQIDSMSLPIFMLECQHDVEQSKEGLVHKKYDDHIHPISYSQFHAKFGSRDAWKYFHKTPFSDWSRTKTKFHANVAGFLNVASANTVLPGHVFLVPYSFPKDTAPADVAVRLLTELTPFAFDGKTWQQLVDDAWKRLNANQHFDKVSDKINYQTEYYSQMIPQYARPILQNYRVGVGANSHSEDQVRNMFNIGFGFTFVPSNPGETDALEDIDLAQRVDYSLPHVFDGAKMGYTRFHVLCPDDVSKEPVIVSGVEVYPPMPYPDVMEPDNLHDSALFRYQMCNRRYRDPELTKSGETTDLMLKANDDFGQGMQMVYLKNLLANISLSMEEKREEHLAPEIRTANLQQMENSEDKDLLLQRRRLEVEQFDKQANKPVRSPGVNRFSRR